MLRITLSIAALTALSACQVEEDTNLPRASLNEGPDRQVLVGRLFFADENDRHKAIKVGSKYEANLAEYTATADVTYLDLTSSRSAALLRVVFRETLGIERTTGSCENSKPAIDLISMRLAKASITHKVEYDSPMGHCVDFRPEDGPAVEDVDTEYGEIMEARRQMLEQGGCRASVHALRTQEGETREQLQETLELCQREAADGDPGAKYDLAFLYFDPRFGPNEDLAIDLVRQSAADGYATAQFWVGWQSENGDHLPKNIGEAIKWYERAADQGHWMAIDRLARAYENGELGFGRDLAKAEELRSRRSCKLKKEEC